MAFFAFAFIAQVFDYNIILGLAEESFGGLLALFLFVSDRFDGYVFIFGKIK